MVWKLVNSGIWILEECHISLFQKKKECHILQRRILDCYDSYKHNTSQVNVKTAATSLHLLYIWTRLHWHFCYNLESLTQTWECKYARNVTTSGWVCICGHAMDVWIGVYMHVWDIWLLMCVCVSFLHTFFVCWSSRPGASQGSEAFGDGSAVVYNLQDLFFYSDYFLGQISILILSSFYSLDFGVL